MRNKQNAKQLNLIELQPTHKKPIQSLSFPSTDADWVFLKSLGPDRRIHDVRFYLNETKTGSIGVKMTFSSGEVIDLGKVGTIAEKGLDFASKDLKSFKIDKPDGNTRKISTLDTNGKEAF
jgi:hypothetical protein